VLADGSYATQSALTSEPEISSKGTSSGSSVPHLRALILGGDWFLAAVLGYSLTKLALKAQQQDMEQITKNMIVVDVLTLLTGLARYGQSKVPANPIDPDSQERLYQCIKVLTEPDPLTRDLIISDCRVSFAAMIAEQARSKPLEKTKKEVEVQVDDLIKVRQIRGRKAHGADDADDFDDSDMSKATGTQDTQEDLSLRLNRVYQLTGFSDPIYAEAYINVHQYDIVYDVVVINQTGETLQNVALELATLGDLKLVERPQTHTIGPHDKKMIKANIKVSSTETGIIFGNIVYDIAGVTSSDRNCVILNDIHIDIMDYISPATCSELKFRSMWAEFEWENKVVVNSNITDVNEFLKHIIQSTNMKCLTTESALAGECGFLSANLYARSVFGEDALANLSIEKQADGKIGGYIRIRSKTQGIALSLGDKITLKQRVATTGKA
jgi:coatomer subunit beta